MTNAKQEPSQEVIDADDNNRTPSPTESEPTDGNIVLHCILRNNVERLQHCVENEEHPYHGDFETLLNKRTIDGRSPLDLAVLLARENILDFFIEQNVDINNTTESGYTSLHHAAAWGRLRCMRTLAENGCDLQVKNKNGERARETALRYKQTECVEYFDWAEAKQALEASIKLMRDTMAEPEKIQGRLNREDKNTTNALCTEKEQWVVNTPEATTQDFIAQKEEFEKALVPIWEKINEPLPEKPEKK